MRSIATVSRMKIVTYNINGLRTRIIPYKTLHAFLSALDADIICFQETKLSRQELSADIAMAEGYEAFFSCTRTSIKGRIGYSGVATFCRASISACEPCISGALPFAADEGFTGLLHLSKRGEIEGVDRVGYYDDVLNMGMTHAELLQLDREGRCVVTDHGSFVLFNIYGPCVQPDDTARMEFKLKFYQVLQCRWDSLLRAGKRLIIVGDLNITPYPIDSCDPGPYFNSNPCRRWLRSLLSTNGGPFTDVYRAVHGLKKGAYTCWSQASGADEFNYGTRIDLILATGLCTHAGAGACKDCKGFSNLAVQDCDIMVEFKRFKEDNAPRWSGGRSMKLEGSDHAPVFLLLKDQPLVKPHQVPSFAVRFLPQLHGRQQSIHALLRKIDRSTNAAHTHLLSEMMLHVGSEEGFFDDENIEVTSQLASFQANSEIAGVETDSSEVKGKAYPPLETSLDRSTSFLKVQASQKIKKKIAQKASQTNLTAFFTRSSHHSAVSTKHSIDNGGSLCQSQEVSQDCPSSMQESIDLNGTKGSCIDAAMHEENSQACNGFVASNEAADESINEHNAMDSNLQSRRSHAELKKTNVKEENAQAQWKRIRDLMARCIPLCRHGEPCVARVVKKSGPNLGRGFYVCARGKGPSSNPEARCDHFEWASEKSKK